MIASAREAAATLPVSRWRDPAAWATTVDVLAILAALSLPWSTSAVAILTALLFLAWLPFLDVQDFLRSLRDPICAAPVALFALACIGTLWSDAAWPVRLHAINPTVKLLFIPILIYQFRRSERGLWVFIAFLVSCVLLTIASTAVAFDPSLSLKPNADRGIIVKNYIDQSHEFSLCAVALVYPVVSLLRARRWLPALLLVATMLAFLANMAFVVTSRTALVTIPVMLAAFAVVHLTWRTSLLLAVATIVIAGVAWATAPPLRQRIATITSEYQAYRDDRATTSVGERLEFWRKSLRFFAEAPVIGHGSGSTRHLFELAASGRTDLASGQVIGNPHNQTLYVAIQWGLAGVATLFILWASHLLLFRGEGLVPWLGLLVVVQNVVTSLFNSHLFDFHEGWMYVLGVGVAAGMVLKAQGGEQDARAGTP